MMTQPWLGTVLVTYLLLGCGWSRSALAQGTTLLPPAQATPPASLPLQQSVTPQPPAIQQTGGTLPRGVVKSRVLARINGSPILEEEVTMTALPFLQGRKKQVPEQYWAQLEQEAYKQVLDDIITEEAIIQDAAIKIPPPVMKKFQDMLNKEFDKILKKDKQAPQTEDPEQLKAYYESRGQSVDIMRRQFIRRQLALEWVREKTRSYVDAETTREKLLEYYRANPAEFTRPERVVWQHIFVDVDRYESAAAARQVAETVWQLLRSAKTDAEFNALVDKYADVDSKTRRGSGQGNLKGEIRPKELEPFVFAQATGGQGPVVETSRGFHVFRVTEHTPHEVMTFEKASTELKRKLENKLIEAEFTRIGKEMRDKAFVEILDKP
jgi:parvulin-like peptidyl-prolyl isomerase